MAVYGYTKNYKLIKPQFDADTWHDYEYDNLDTIDAVLSAIFASGDWQGFWKSNAHYAAGGVVIDKDTDTMYKVMVEHTTSAGSFVAEQTAHPDYYELWSPNNLAESWATKTDGKVSNEDYSAKAYAMSSGLISEGSAKEWAIGSGAIGNTNEYSAKKYATDAHNDYISMTTNTNVSAVASNINNVNAVGQSISSVNTVASNISSVNTVAGVSTDVPAVASVASSVSTVADNTANITTVATNISDVNTAATNIIAIQDAPTAATNAANSAIASANSAIASADSANNSHIWAEGTDAQIQALGGEKSAKGWAEASTNLNYTNITNCLTKIPQDIKLELNNGTLTLKAGSKVYVPNGFEADGTTPKFDVVVIESDITDIADSARQSMVWCRKINGKYYIDSPLPLTYCYSGSTAPTSFYVGKLALWYDTNTNLIKYTNNSGATWDNQGHSLPLAIVTETTTAYISIDQVFNGFGYIGSTVFALPGVKGLIPNGRNEDGTLKNIEFTTTSVLTIQRDFTGNHYIMLSSNFIGEYGFILTTYDENKNLNFDDYAKTAISLCNCGSCVLDSGRITTFTPKTAFHAVDRNDSSWLSGLGMPSNRYIDLTLGASGSTYTAPANGWFCLLKIAKDTQHITMLTKGGSFGVRSIAGANTATIVCFCPVIKGDIMTLTYTASENTTSFKFYYAEGENNVQSNQRQ